MQTKSLLLDTHIWIWYVLGDAHLNKSILTAIKNAAEIGELFLATISIWEISLLTAKQRISFDRPCRDWIDTSINETGINLITLSSHIAIESAYLPGDLHSDPADRIIIASARIENLTLVTADQKIITYAQQKHINVLPT